MANGDLNKSLAKKRINGRAILNWINRNNTIVIFLLLIIVSSIISKNFFTMKNITNILRQNASLGIVSLGMLMVVMTGGIDLSVGTVLTLGNVVFAVVLAKGYPLPVAIVIALLAGLLCGVLSGYMISYRRIAAFVTTLAVMSIAKGVAFIISNGASIQIKNVFYNSFSRSYFLGFPSQFWVMIVIFTVVFLVFRYTAYGRLVLAIGSNEEAVRLSGIRVNNFKLSVYCASGILAALAGIIVTGRTGVGSPLVGDGTEMDAIASAVIAGASLNGGNGSVIKTLFGVFTLGLISNIMNLMKVPAYPQLIIKGIIILAAVLLQQFSQSQSEGD